MKHRQPISGDLSAIERLCIDKGVRVTNQRRVVAMVLSECCDQPDIQELHRRVRKVDPRIALSTVYRTVRLLCNKGILNRRNLGMGRACVERISDRGHDYLVELQSGKIVEFRSNEIYRLLVGIAQRLGYRMVRHELQLYVVPADETCGSVQRDPLRTRPKFGN